jgi:hypothetical protein
MANLFKDNFVLDQGHRFESSYSQDRFNIPLSFFFHVGIEVLPQVNILPKTSLQLIVRRNRLFSEVIAKSEQTK